MKKNPLGGIHLEKMARDLKLDIGVISLAFNFSEGTPADKRVIETLGILLYGGVMERWHEHQHTWPTDEKMAVIRYIARKFYRRNVPPACSAIV